MIDFCEEQDVRVGVLRLDGDITVQRAEELRQNLISALGNADKVYVDFSEVSSIDLSCLQLLCAAHRASTRLQKTLRLKDPIPDYFRQAAGSAGFSRHTGCSSDINRTCVWANLFCGSPEAASRNKVNS